MGRWPWHRRLFRAFDALRLTPSEIANLTKWEGTRWAKERYEKEQSITIQDTAADGMPDYRHVQNENWVDEQPYGIDNYMTLLAGSHPAIVYARREGQAEECLVSAATVPSHPQVASLRGTRPAVAGFDMDEDEVMNDVEGGNQDDSDDGVVTQSIGLQLNERLRERVAAHNAGDTSQPLDEDWEQWLKNALETGNLNMVTQHADLPFVHSRYTSHASSAAGSASNSNSNPPSGDAGGQNTGEVAGDSGDSGLTYSTIVPSQILHSARQGNRGEIPEFLHDVLRQTIEGEAYPEDVSELGEVLPSDLSTATPSSPSAGRARDRTATWRRTYSDLRLPSQ